MTSTTEERPLIVKADRKQVYEAMNRLYNEVENLTFRVTEDLDPADETRTVTHENIAELSVVLEDLDIHITELQQMRERLERQRRYLTHAYAEQTTKGRDDA